LYITHDNEKWDILFDKNNMWSSLKQPTGLYTHNDDMYICDSGNNRILVYNFITKECIVLVASSDLSFPMDIQGLNQEEFLIADYGNDDIKVFNIITNQLKSLFPENYSDSPNAPISIEIINENEFIVSESEGSKIRKYAKSGISWIASVIAGGKYGDDSFQMGIGSGLRFPEGLLALDNGDLLFTDTGN